MGEIIKAYIVPHPPNIIPEVGKGKEHVAKATIEAYETVGKQIAELAPQVIIVTTPHGTVYSDYIHISPGDFLEGSFADFGVSQPSYRFKTDKDLIDKIIAIAQSHDIKAGGLGGNNSNLDHGSLVPLYFIERNYKNFLLIRISIADFLPEQLYIFGSCIQKAVAQSDYNAVFIASGDLSHWIKKNAEDYADEASAFDHMIIEAVKEADFKKLFDIDADFCNRVGECGLRSFIMMAGALNGYGIKPHILSYECAFGVGNMIAELSTDGRDLSRDLLSFLECKKKNEINATRKAEDPYVQLARRAAEAFVKTGKVINTPDFLPEEMLHTRAGVFVSIKKNGRLRGCVGTISSTTDSLAEEIVQNAISAATQDIRFSPVNNFELNELIYRVDIMSETNPTDMTNESDILHYGVIVNSGPRRGLLLPGLDGVSTPEQQIDIALSKAGIRKDEHYLAVRFKVKRHI